MSKTVDRFSAGTVLAGKLRVVRRLGFGGMGAVYEVEHELTRHRRALKLLHAEMRVVPGVVERFLREASAAGRIGNPHIVETFDAGYLDTGEPYIVMELLEGKTLAMLLEERGALSVDRACVILEQVADGVAAAHAAGIVHRDLKPENIFLTGAELSFVKLLDFGVSKFDSGTTGVPNLTLEGSPIGTPYYMSPEQVRGEKSVDARADVYALGVVFYECLTGNKPFLAETLPHLAVLIHEGRFQQPTSLVPGLPSAVDVIVSRAMASDPNERYARAQDFAAQLGRLRDSLGPLGHGRTQPAVTQPAPLTGTLTPAPVSRTSELTHRTKSAALVPLGIAAGILIVGAALFFSRARSEAPPLAEEASSSAPVLRSTATETLSVASGPSLVPPSPVVAPSASQATPHPVASASAPMPGTGAPVRRSPSAPSRAQKHGLSEENPFR